MRSAVSEDERAGLPSEAPGTHIGAIAAGSKLPSNQRPKLRTFLEALQSDILAAEPEGLGFLLGSYTDAQLPCLSSYVAFARSSTS